MDLCLKDRVTRSIVEISLNADDAMSEEVTIKKANGVANDLVDASCSSTQSLKEASYNMKKKGQLATSPTMKSPKRRVGEKYEIVSTNKEIGDCLKDLL